jgi:hypothetical protein
MFRKIMLVGLLASTALVTSCTGENSIENANEQYSLGKSHTKKDDVVAFGWFMKAANQGHMDSQFEVGRMYALGEGVSTDQLKAAEWYGKAAEQGLRHAQRNLGRMYLEGDGVKKDPEKARYWLSKAADQGDMDARILLGNVTDGELLLGVTKALSP